MTRQAISTTRKIRAQTIGVIAQKALSDSSAAKVMGITARGIFLKSAVKWVVFLSFEHSRGPLTVNLKGDLSPLGGLTPDERLLVSPGRITAPKQQIEISLESAQIWEAAAVSTSIAPQKEQQQRMRTVARNAYTQKSPAGLSDLIPLLLSEHTTHPQADKLLVIQSHLRKADIPALAHSLGKLLGLGGGLTPSWDDFTLGLLLTLNRWGPGLPSPFDPEPLNSALIEAAYSRTTTISANLIECATTGQADERLIEALDYVFAGKGNEGGVLDGLLNWGNSSGVDALLGIITANWA